MKKTFKLFIISGLVSAALFSCKQKPAEESSNPFYGAYNTPFEVPPFDKIMAKHYVPAFEKGMTEGVVELQNYLPQLSEKGSRDDISIAGILVRKDLMKKK